MLDLHESIDLIKGVVQGYASKSQLIIDAGGDSRLLIFELFLAWLSLSSELLKNKTRNIRERFLEYIDWII